MRKALVIPFKDFQELIVPCAMGCGKVLDPTEVHYVDNNGDIYCPSCRAILALAPDTWKARRRAEEKN